MLWCSFVFRFFSDFRPKRIFVFARLCHTRIYFTNPIQRNVSPTTILGSKSENHDRKRRTRTQHTAVGAIPVRYIYIERERFTKRLLKYDDVRVPCRVATHVLYVNTTVHAWSRTKRFIETSAFVVRLSASRHSRRRRAYVAFSVTLLKRQKRVIIWCCSVVSRVSDPGNRSRVRSDFERSR